ncbi:MAG: rhodanese-like domain-containing protein [Candidatus Dadabacteria bacterium]|nr:MAG: rhodanese-like domain-containing protein [Candidatus Dadabacteria bacterium]
MQHVTPDEALHLVEDEGYVYLDVRTEAEFQAGHPAGSVCIPAFLRTPAGMAPNPEFLDIARRHLKLDTPIVVGCQAGGRSAKAAEWLEQAGYQTVVNCSGGFGGGRDPETMQPVPGWQAAGHPVETGGEALR